MWGRSMTELAAAAEPMICEPGGSGLIFPIFDGENDWSPSKRSWMYGGMLLYCFLGVAIVADKFMGAIERITATERQVMMNFGKGKVRVSAHHARDGAVWREPCRARARKKAACSAPPPRTT